MSALVPSFAKINLGLHIGKLRADGFHELRTVYQTIALHDLISVSLQRGSGIEIRCEDPRVPTDSSNTCYKIIERAIDVLKAPGRVVIEIEKRLPVQGGLGGASGNAVAALLALECALRQQLSAAEKLRIAAEVGSDIPLFLIGGTVLGVGHGEEVYPLPDSPPMPCVIGLPNVAVSTPKAFADWDRTYGGVSCEGTSGTLDAIGISRIEGTSMLGKTSATSKAATSSRAEQTRPPTSNAKLTVPAHSDRMLKFSREISAWLNAVPSTGGRRSGVSARGGGRAESPLLDLVRTGIENDFERVVFPKYPELLEVKRVLEKEGARYASLSGSGSAIYGLFDSQKKATAAAKKLAQSGTQAVVTSTLTRQQYWKRLLATSS